MARLTDQHDLAITDPVHQRCQIGGFDAVEYLGMARDQVGQDAGHLCRGGKHLRRPDVGFGGFPLPALVADQRHKAQVGQIFLHELALAAPCDADQFLPTRINADRHHHAAPGGKLVLQHFRHEARAPRHKNCVKRSLFDPASGAVVVPLMKIPASDVDQGRGGGFGMLADPFDDEHLTRDRGENGRDIARARPDLQHLFAALQAQRPDHVSSDVGLNQYQTFCNRNRPVFIGAGAQMFGQKRVAGDQTHRRQNLVTSNAARDDLVADHVPTLCRGVLHRWSPCS